MERKTALQRSEIWNNIYEVLARLDLKETEGDSLDRSSAATQIEEAVKNVLIQELNKKSKAIEDQCHFFGVTEKYVNGSKKVINDMINFLKNK